MPRVPVSPGHSQHQESEQCSKQESMSASAYVWQQGPQMQKDLWGACRGEPSKHTGSSL